MRVEVTASGNRFAEQQASAVELAAEAYGSGAIDACKGDAIMVMQTPAEQIQVGNGYFWILQTYPDDDYTPAYGITDECSKLNISIATSKQLALLPGMTQPMADSIVLWRGGTAASTTAAREPMPVIIQRLPALMWSRDRRLNPSKNSHW